MKKWTRAMALFFALAMVAAACSSDGAAEDAADGGAEDSGEEAAAFSPGSPECVAPADPGGGWDFTCRTIGQMFEDLDVTGNVVITNQPGGGGGVAFSDIAGNRNDATDLVIAASPAPSSARRRGWPCDETSSSVVMTAKP